MKYESTRGGTTPVSSATAIKMGIAPDGGLFVPTEEVKLAQGQLAAMRGMSYQERAQSILSLFLTDFSAAEIARCVGGAYTREKFDNPQIAPLVKLRDKLHILELWHGPTCAFKDMALQILPHLLTTSVQDGRRSGNSNPGSHFR